MTSARARRALRALAADPQNNLRAWVSSRGRGARRVEVIHDSAAAAGKSSGRATGTSEDASIDLDADSNSDSVDVAEIILAALVRSRVLARVLAAQRLDIVGVERAAVLARDGRRRRARRGPAARALRDFVVAAVARTAR